MGGKRKNITKLSIVQVGTKAFLENGYSKTTMKYIGERLGISTGNITFYYPTKEHLLSILVEMLFDFQWGMFKNHMENVEELIYSFCLELLAMASVCDENENTKELYVSAYTHSMTLDIIRRYDLKKAQEVFREYCKDWNQGQFDEAEMIASGIEYAILCTNNDNIPLENRIKKALDSILYVYNVPKNERDFYINKVFETDYRSMGCEIFDGFYKYIEKKNTDAIKGV